MTVLTTPLQFERLIVTSHCYYWNAHFDDYDGAPDSGWQCTGSSLGMNQNIEISAVYDFYVTWEDWKDETLCAHRPMFREDICPIS